MGRMTTIVIGVVALVAAALAVYLWVGQTEAAAEVKTAIEARQKAMKGNGGQMKAINDFIEKGEGDAAGVQEHAKAIAETAKIIPSVFPKGSGMDDGHGVKTAAKADIWTDWAGFEAAAANLGTQATKLAEVAATGDKAAIAAQFGVVGQDGCGGCHTKYRAKTE